VLLAFYNDPAKRALMKPEAVFEVESGLKLSAFDITAASVVRSDWYQAMRQFFERFDYFVLPTAQLFPFDANIHWPQEIAGRKMETYHEWMKGVLPITISGCPALAAPAGFSRPGSTDRHPNSRSEPVRTDVSATGLCLRHRNSVAE
jgi:amidase